MAMIKYGVEIISDTKDRVIMYKTKEVARRNAEKFAEGRADGENVVLFSALCDDAGKLATNEFNILEAWG